MADGENLGIRVIRRGGVYYMGKRYPLHGLGWHDGELFIITGFDQSGRIQGVVKKNTKRGALKAHVELVREGHLLAAKKVLGLLQSGVITLGVSTEEVEAEYALERNGYRGSLLRGGHSIRFSIWE